MNSNDEEIVWMSYQDFMVQVEKLEFARGFLAYCIQSGYQFTDFAEVEEIQYLPVDEVISLAKHVWPMFYLREVPTVNSWSN